MPDHDRLCSLILEHWSRYHPSMLAQLKQQNRLQEEVNVFVGRREDILRRDEETGWKIRKRLILLDQNVLLAKVITTFF